MEKKSSRVGGIVSAVMVAVLVLFTGTVAANTVRQSEFYSKSRVISLIFSQDGIAVTDIAGNKRNVDMMLKFVGALTSAYINFELIPVNEAGTFAAVFRSVPPEVTIDKFEYHRKNLTITGTASALEEYERFLDSLQEDGYFESVTGHHYLTTDDQIRFTLACTADTGTTAPAFQLSPFFDSAAG